MFIDFRERDERERERERKGGTLMCTIFLANKGISLSIMLINKLTGADC